MDRATDQPALPELNHSRNRVSRKITDTSMVRVVISMDRVDTIRSTTTGIAVTVKDLECA